MSNSYSHPFTGPSNGYLFSSYNEICEQCTCLDPMKGPNVEYVYNQYIQSVLS